MPDPLVMYVIYDSPRDYPGEVVVRRQYVEHRRIRIDPELFLRGLSVESVRKDLRHLIPGLVRSPLPEPDPAIAEVWL